MCTICLRICYKMKIFNSTCVITFQNTNHGVIPNILIDFSIVRTCYSVKLVLLDLEMFFELIEIFTCYKELYYT